MGTWPPTTSFMAGPESLYAMYWILVPAWTLNTSPMMCRGVPDLAEAKARLPVLPLAMMSLTLLRPELALTAMTKAALTSGATVEK